VQRIERSVGQPWPDAAELTVVHHGHEHHPIDGELLDLAEQGLAAGNISLASLLLEEIVDIGVAAIGIAPFRVDECLYPARRIAELPTAERKIPWSLFPRQSAR
jgi:hypothetical protein